MPGTPPGKQEVTNKVKLSDSKCPTLKNLVEFKPWSSFLWLLLRIYPKYNLWQEDTTNSRAASRGNIVYTNGIIRALKSASTSRAFPKGEVDAALSTSRALSGFILMETQWAGTDSVPTLQMRSLRHREVDYFVQCDIVWRWLSQHLIYRVWFQNLCFQPLPNIAFLELLSPSALSFRIFSLDFNSRF